MFYIDKEDPSYKFLKKHFKESTIQERYEAMIVRAEQFIEALNLRDKVYLNKAILNVTVLDYFTDIAKLKEFEKIEFTNKNKITAYMVYWWLKRRPLQLIQSDGMEERLVYINEEFLVTLFVKDILSNIESPITAEQEYRDFVKHLFYHLKYRLSTPQNLELVLMSINNGLILGKKQN